MSSQLPPDRPLDFTLSAKPTTAVVKGQRAIQCRIIRETEKAILVTVQDTEQDEWFPLSTVSYIQYTKDIGYCDVIHAADWICDKKGL